MKLSALQASLAALAIFSTGEALADAAQHEPFLQLAQAEDGGQFDAVRKFIAGGKDVSRLDEERLQQRLNRARKFREVEGLPAELDQQLQMEIAQLEAEMARRQQAAPSQPEEPVVEKIEQQPKLEDPPLPPDTSGQAQQQPVQQQPAQTEAQPPAESQVQTQAEAPAQPAASGAPEIAAFLQSVRPASELNPDELSQQMRRATELAQTPGIAPAQRRALRQVIRDARTAMRGKGGGKQQQQQQEQVQQPPPAQQAPVAEQPAQKPAAGQQAQPPAKPTDQQLAKPANVDPALEQRARAILADNVDVQTLKRKQLRQRLSDIRDLLATNQLTAETREALREKLARERQVLRSEVAVEEGVPPLRQQPQDQQPGKQPGKQQGGNGNGGSGSANGNVVINNNTDVRVILQDRRPPQQLEDAELVRRIDVYRNVVMDDRYDEQQRRLWRQRMEEDRRFLRRQMMEERRQREARLRAGEFEFGFEIEDRYDPGRDVQDDVFAAEVEDEEIADVLSAPPRRQIERRYTVEEIERSPEARNAVARIEIDTVHFGFGEGFLREEEIDKLDRIAQVLEKILAKHPDEVFLIEGHTDAVGSDAANLQLSRERAAAVKEALTTYYVIPGESLKTVGLGERYLKIPTNQPEAENRRVSLARITALVSQAD